MGSAKAARTIPVSVAVLRPPGVSASSARRLLSAPPQPCSTSRLAKPSCCSQPLMLSSTADSRSCAGMAKEAKPLSITRSGVPPPCSVKEELHQRGRTLLDWLAWEGTAVGDVLRGLGGLRPHREASVRRIVHEEKIPSCTIVRFAGFPSPIHHPGWLTRSHTAAMGASISPLRLHTSRLTLGYTLKS